MQLSSTIERFNPARLAVIGIAAIGALSVAGFFSQLGQPLEIFCHLRFLYVVALIVLSALSLIFKRRIACALGVFFIAINLVAIVPYYWPPNHPACAQGAPRVKLFCANLWGAHNHDYESTLRAVRTANPDIIGFSEITAPWLDRLKAGLPQYPYCIAEPHLGGVALFSRFPISGGRVNYSSTLKRPRIHAKVMIANREVTVIIAHPFVPDYRFQLRNNELSEIATEVRASKEPAIVAGDLNCSPWSYYFTRLEEDGNLVDSERGFGIQPSWGLKPKTKFHLRIDFPPVIPIDHCLATKDFVTLHRFVGPAIGSDHLPVNAEFCLRD